jgi:hypothetical protein
MSGRGLEREHLGQNLDNLSDSVEILKEKDLVLFSNNFWLFCYELLGKT